MHIRGIYKKYTRVSDFDTPTHQPTNKCVHKRTLYNVHVYTCMLLGQSHYSASLSDPLSGVNVQTRCVMFVCVSVVLCMHMHGVYVKVQRSTGSPTISARAQP